MRFEILGPLQFVDDAGGLRLVAASRQRVLLAALLLRANQAVPVEELAELVWDGAPPAKAVATVRAYVMRLRHTLGPAGAARIFTRAPGYLIRLDPAELDILQFEELCERAGASARARAWDEVSASAVQALELWRGIPLVDVSCQALRDGCVPHLEQLRVQAVEWRVDADLHRGCHEQVIPQLQALVAEHPLRERFHAQLMLALARGGRQAEALAAYQQARHVLADEIGIEPGPELRGLQQQILTGSPGPVAPRSTDPVRSPSGAAVPRQLPAAVRHFAGRVRELKTLSELLDQNAQAGGTVVISAVSGPAGVGKTALAVHWAHQHVDRFPDGQLYVNLRGFDPGGVPMRTEVAVRRLLAAAAPGLRIPADPEAQIDLYRSCLADQRMLIVLDNARNTEQVRPLLPGSAGCLVLVTSRNRLTGLIAVDGASHVGLDLLSTAEARELLIRRLGTDRIAQADRAATELIGLCARLPLALNIAAARAVIQPDLPLKVVVDELRDARRRLDLLAAGETTADVRAVFSWSYRTLDAATAHVFRLLSLGPGPDISLGAVAALIDRPVEHTAATAATLVHANLLQSAGPDRYRFHDLLRVYAAEQADTQEPVPDRESSLRGLLAWYLRGAVAAARLISPHRRLPPLDTPDRSPGLPVFGSAEDAVRWFDAEYANLVAALDVAGRHSWHDIVWKLAIALWDVCHLRGHNSDLIATHEQALTSARQLRDRAAEGWLLSHLSVAYSDTGLPEKAVDCLRQALTIDRETGNRRSEAVNLVNLGYAYHTQNLFEQAILTLDEAATAARHCGHWRAEAAALNNIGEAHLQLDQPDHALHYTNRALAIYRAHSDRHGEAAATVSTGEINRLLGNTTEAFRLSTQALALNRETGNRREEANALTSLGHLHLANGRRDQARQHWLNAEAIFQRIGDPKATELRTQLDILD